jgi:two-component system CheB/CheR fusion protein
VGRPLRDLQLSYRPVELRSLIERAELERRTVSVKDIEWRSLAGEVRWLDLTITPVLVEEDRSRGMLVTFTDMTGFRRLQRELEQSHMELETAYEELQSTNEELETTNEELQSTVEELETTNEELQSTNEELETMNEEMQSTNEELETINDEIRTRTDQLNETNALMAAIVTSLGAGIVVIDDDFNIEVWNEAAAELWGVRPDEAEGMHLMNLELGLPLEQLHKPLRAALAGERTELDVPAVNRRGKSITCAMTVTPLHAPGAEPRGAILVMEAR